MKFTGSILLLVSLAVSYSCSNTRFLPENQLLYTGRKKIEIIPEQQDMKTGSVKNTARSITDHKVNNALFGRRVLPPLGLWTYNYWHVKEENKFWSWSYEKLSSEPVLISEVNPDLRAQKIENELFDAGYFNNVAWATVDTSARNPRKARVSYTIMIGVPFRYDSIIFEDPVDPVDSLIAVGPIRNRIRPGDRYNLNELKSARDDQSLRIQNSGYYYFQPEFIVLTADTAGSGSELDLYVKKEDELPESILSTYRIGDITVHISHPSDTGSTHTTRIGDLEIVSTRDYVKPGVLENSIYMKKGDLYSFSSYQATLTRLNNLGTFSYVKIDLEHPETDTVSDLLDVNIELLLSDFINVDLEADLVTKSTGFSGPEVMLGLAHSNIFRGAEILHVGLEAGFEWQWGKKEEDQLGTFSYEFGLRSGVTFPGLILPRGWKKQRPLTHQQTAVNLDFRIFNRTAYYQMFSSMVKLGYNWGESREIQHIFYPVYINSVNLLKTTQAFDSVFNDNIYIRKSFEEQNIIGVRYEFIYDNTFRRRPRNMMYHLGLNSAGNVLDLFAGIGKNSSERPYTINNLIYSQFIKFTSDFRYYFNGRNNNLVCRIYAGIGLPYSNSTVMPYVEQFFSGGAYSIRGFTSRLLGPGSYYEEDRGGYIDQSGDLKLEANLEYRFSMSKILKGALFLETGNIWLVNEDENRPGAEFRFNNFIDELAVGTGFGLRFDFTFFVLRTDYGIPLRTPYKNNATESQWLLGESRFFRNGLFYLAIGYPF